MTRRRFVIWCLVIGCVVFGQTRGAHAQATPQQWLTGTLHVIWGYTQNHEEHREYLLAEPNGRTTELMISDDVLVQAGGVLSLNRKLVSVQATQARVEQPTGMPLTVRLISRIGSTSRTQSRLGGAQPWITLMCKFSDNATEPKDYAFFAGMYGSTFPGLNHYWQEQSYGTINIDGSGVAGTGWFTMPSPRSTYVVGDALNETLISQDCASAADSVVDFRNYVGINMMFNDDLGGPARGGSTTITVDGVRGSWNATWMPPWAHFDLSVLAHEMGHGFGLPHSSGSYGSIYDSAWDVMSDPMWNCQASRDATYGCIGQHTNAYHKDKLGWINSNQKYIAAGSASIVIDDLALASTTNYRMAQIPINKLGTRFYTVEVRKLTGYDVKLPGFVVVIHEVDTIRDRPAQVIDSDNNGNNADAGAMWTTGETFTAAAIGLTVTVNAQTTNGYSVTISIPIPTPVLTPTNIPISSQTGEFVGWGLSSSGQITAPNSDADIVDISAGANHTLVLRSNGIVSGWGNNGSGQVSIPATLSDVVAIDAGDAHSLALKADGTVVGWGNTDYGRATPPSDLRDVIAVSAGLYHSLALKSDGTIIGWGFNGVGETSQPSAVENAVAISANAQSSMAVLADGRVIAWGYLGGSNQLAVPSGLTNVVDIAVGIRHAVALHANGTVTTWGDNDKNQQNVPIGLSNVVEIDTSGHHTIARIADGTVVVWGSNETNQADVPNTLGNVRGVAAGSHHTVVFRRVDSPSTTPTQTSTPTPVATPTQTAMWTATPTSTVTASPTHVVTPTQTAIWTPSYTPTHTATPTRLATRTQTASRTRTSTPTITRTSTRSPTRTTSLQRPGRFTKTGPTNNNVNRPVNITLSWIISPAAESYEYCISTAPTCTLWINVGNVRSTMVKNLQRNRSYYWNIRAKNRVGVTNANDGLWKFTTVR